MQLDSRRRARQRGVALITVLLALLLLTAIAFGLMYMSNTETMINANFRSVQQAFFGSQAGLQEARERLMSTIVPPLPPVPPHGIVGPVNLPGPPGSIIYITNPLPGDPAVQPWAAGTPFFDTELCWENFAGLALAQPANAGTPCAVGPPQGAVLAFPSDAPFAGTNAALPYKWVRITLKANNTVTNFPVNGTVPTANTLPICWDGFHEKPLPAGYVSCTPPPPAGTGLPYVYPVYVVTSLAITPSGSRRLTQVEIAQMPPIVTNAALDTLDLVTTSGASVTVNGYDNCQCSCSVGKGAALPSCFTRDANGNATTTPCNSGSFAVFTTQTVSGNGGIVAPTNPTTQQNVPQDQFPYDVANLAASYANAPGAVPITASPYNQTCGGTPYSCGNMSGGTFGTLPSCFPNCSPPPGQLAPGEQDQVTYFPGSVTLTAKGSGAGIIVVNGDLTIEGGMQFYGLIIVTGRFILRGSGQGQNTNIQGGVLAGLGSSADTISGGVNLQYDRCALSHNQQLIPPAILAFRELTY